MPTGAPECCAPYVMNTRQPVVRFTDADAELMEEPRALGTADCEPSWGGDGVFLAGAGYRSVVREGVAFRCVFEVVVEYTFLTRR